MKIAILLNLADKTSGGSFRFNSMIYQALLAQQSSIHHELFFIFEKDNDLATRPDLALPNKLHYRFYFSFQLIKEIFFFVSRRKMISLDNCRSSWLNRKLHAHDVKAVWSVNPLSMMISLPYLTTSWDIAYKITPYFKEFTDSGMQLAKQDKISRSVLAGAFKIIVGTQIGKEQISNAFGISGNRILVQPLPTLYSKSINKLLRNQFQFIYPANFWSHKNHLVIIKAVKDLIADENFPIKFIFTGSDKGNFQYIRNLVSHFALDNYFEFKSFISSEDLVELYGTSNACVYSSLIGPDNLPPLEALAFGSKAIVADIPGAREQLGEFVDYFDPFDSKSLSRLIKQEIVYFNKDYEISSELSTFLHSRSSENYINSVIREVDKLSQILDLSV
jgi:glycosyltransferase involved in cell wall biosynthesis